MNFPVHTKICLSLLDINRINLSASLSLCRFCIFAVTLPKKCVLSTERLTVVNSMAPGRCDSNVDSGISTHVTD